MTHNCDSSSDLPSDPAGFSPPGKPVSLMVAEWFLRISIAAGLLSAVADRLGFWGTADTAGVAWGNWGNFIAYVAKLNWFVPAALHNIIGWIASICEVVISIGLLIGWRLQWFALAAGLLTLSFAVTMTMALGVKSPLDYSVFAIAAGSFYLAANCWKRRLSAV